MAGFDVAMQEQRTRAKSANKFKLDRDIDLELEGQTLFLGYNDLVATGVVIKLLKENLPVATLEEGESGVVILDQTPFYAESGGQAGDAGTLTGASSTAEVLDCQKLQGHFLHQVTVTTGTITVGTELKATVKRDERENTARHHSATHLMHAALREVLGEHVQQRGSLVTFDKLRFDFSHLEAVTPAELQQIEAIVNSHIIANTPVTTNLMDVDAARESGAMALFGEKYDDEVRVLSMGRDGYSKELCGGTHVQQTGDIGLFRIVSEGGIAAGIRRLEAVVGAYALSHIQMQDKVILDLQSKFKCSFEQITGKVDHVLANTKELEREVDNLKSKLAAAAAGDLSGKAIDVSGVKVLAVRIDGIDAKSLRTTMDQMKDKLKSAVVVIAAVNEGKVQLAVGITKDRIPAMKAGDLIKEVGALMGAKGGGKPDMAMAGGGDAGKIELALSHVVSWVESKLQG